MEYRLRYRFAHLAQTDAFGYNGVFDDDSDYTDHIEEPDKITFSFGQSETNNLEQLDSTGVDKAVSSKMVVFGKGYEYVKRWLIDHEAGPINSIQVEIYDMICPKNLGIWEIKADNLQWCDDEECKIEVTLNEYTPVGNCLKNVLVSDNHRGWFPEDGKPGLYTDPITGSQNDDYIHPTYQYCDDVKPQFVQNFIFAVAHGINILINIFLGPIVWVIDKFMDLVSWIGFDLGGEESEDFTDKLSNLYEDIFEAMLGCDRRHPAPFVRTYFINACSKCKVEFRSNIFNDIHSPHSRYYNTCHLFAPNAWGIKEKQVEEDKKNWRPTNAVKDSLLMYAYSLKDMFNAKFKLEDGVFHFHTKDTFPDITVLDFTGEHKQLLISPMCYGWNAQRKYASTTFELAQDIKDLAGDDARHRYSGVKDWTESLTNELNKRFYDGIKEIKVTQYGAARFINDGVEQRLAFKKLNDTDFFPHDILLLDKDVTQLGKLLIWDGVSPYKDAKVIRIAANAGHIVPWKDDYAHTNPTDYYVYNYPLFFEPNTNNGNVPDPSNQTHKNLFELHKIDDPTKTNVHNKTWQATLELCCTTLDLLIRLDMKQDGLMAHLDHLVILTNGETGCIRKIDIDYDRSEIRLAGEIKYT